MNVGAAVSVGDAQFAASVRNGVARIEELISNEISQGDEVFHETLDQLGATVNRFRPFFTVLAAHFGDNPDAWQVTVTGATIELIHRATLCHRSVLDDEKICRPASRSHTHLANNFAILAGDYQIATASQLASRLGPEAFGIVAETFAEIVSGHMRESPRTPVHLDTIENYVRVVQNKTGSLIETSARLGATFAGATNEHTYRLARLGQMIGTTIKISDDIIAVSADHAKSVTLASPKPQPGTTTRGPLYDCDEHAPSSDWPREFATGPIDDHHTAQPPKLLLSTSGICSAKNSVVSHASEAREQLAYLPNCAARRALAALIDSTISRNT